MAQPFSPEQRDAIRARLLESARQHIVSDGVKKTSLDMLTSDAGISKSSFYKFYDSKEQLFLTIAAEWESQVISCAQKALENAAGQSDQERAAAMVCSAFETIHHLGICRFLSEDLFELVKLMPESDAKIHYLSSAHGIFDMLHQSQIHFSAPDETVLACIQILYLSILHIDQIGLSFFPALRMLVVGACAELVV